MKIQLTEAIKFGDEEITELDLRKPTIEDITRTGYLYTLDPKTQSPIFDAKIVVEYLSRLSSLPPSTIKQMSARDFDTARWYLLNFFGDSAAVN